MLHETERKRVKQVKLNQEMYARVLLLLMKGKHSAHDVSREIGCHIITAQSLLNCWRKHKIIHICAWIKDTMNRDSIPVYRWGENEDCPRTRLTPAQRTARYKAKKQDGIPARKQRKQSNAAMQLLM